ncbi:hypothetical protein VC83_02903 [Pseudogymnoascus destructans]|uniref:HAT C-terminal dimerisation domain-containing protein n=1 Tax=Pseudogymnoascus destructans TaxID=655981 RepID=A0A177AED3_9PEZI|nr:uncharacterized protein VC83_02903 [Pseudogymnoascus destructans]OAF60170.1 hypothetical protein VC83_02903 [Pseudogymnoascus destructans]
MVKELSSEPTRYHDGVIHHIPCFAHIVQLAQKALLGSIRLNPTKSELQTDWDENSANEIRDLSKERGLPWILAKLRKLAVFVNSSLQRRERFMGIQRQCIKDGAKVLRLIQDVLTRWDSTLHMMLQAVLLQEAVNKFTTEFTAANIFHISPPEWKHITYLIDVTRQFSFWTSNMAPSHQPPLLWWKDNERLFPGFAAMARDILCIPASEALVERVFSTARAVCNYRRNQMAPETIRGIMLVFYQQKIEREQLFEHYSVTDIIDSTYMNDEEISFEYNALIDNIQEKMALQYIPDRSPRQPNTYDQTRRNKDRFEFVQSRRGLHSLPRVQRSQGQCKDASVPRYSKNLSQNCYGHYKHGIRLGGVSNQ